MRTSWAVNHRTDFPASSEAHALPFGRTPSPLGEINPPWLLFLGEDEGALARAATLWLSNHLGTRPLTVLIPPEPDTLPLTVEGLSPVESPGGVAIYAHRIDRAFYRSFSRSSANCLTSPTYLLPRLCRAAAGGAPVTFVATAIESALVRRGGESLIHRGLATRFELRHLPTHNLTEQPPSQDDASAESAIQGPRSAAACLAIGLKSPDRASRLAAYERAVALDPDSAVAHFCLATSHLEHERVTEAVEELARALQLDPRFAAAHYERGKALVRSNDMDGALAAFRSTTELLPEFASGWGNLGAALGETDDAAGAESALKRALELDPLSHPLHNNLGVTYRDQGRYEEAEGEFRRVLELAPDFVFGHYNLAYNLYLQTRYDDAIRLFEKAQSMDRTRSPRQALLLAHARLAGGDPDGAYRDYRDVFERLDGAMRQNMRSVAEWDLKQLARTRGVSPELKKAAGLLAKLARDEEQNGTKGRR